MDFQVLFNVGGGLATALIVWLLNGYRSEQDQQRSRIHELVGKMQALEISQARSDTSLGHINKELSEIKHMLNQLVERLSKEGRP